MIARSLLATPASNSRMIEKALLSNADAVLIDLEDAVAPNAKVAARANVVHALTELDWGATRRAYRINALSTEYFYRDLIEVVEAAGGSLDLVVVPKVERAEDVATIDTLLTAMEMSVGLEPGAIRMAAQIETVGGLVNVERIAAASPRLLSLDFGPGDYAASAGMPAEAIGVAGNWDRLYPGHRFHYPMARLVAAARTARVAPIDGPSAEFRDLDALREGSLFARALGYEGKWCIHPAQVPVVNDVFSPTDAECGWARGVMAAYEQAQREGQGAIRDEGVMVDAATVRMAARVLERLDAGRA